MGTEQKKHSKKSLIQLKKEAELTFEKAAKSYSNGEYELSLEAGASAIELYLQLEDYDKAFQLKIMTSQVHILQRKIEIASSYAENLLKETITHFGSIHPYVASIYSNLGYLHSVLLQDIQKGIYFDEKCLEIRLETESQNKEVIARSYNNLGFSYGRMEDYDRQFLYLQKALNICKETYPNLRDHVTEIYDNLSNYYLYVLHDYENAIAHQHTALEIRKQVLGESHYLVFQSYINLGECHKEKGDVKKALEYYNIALDGFNVVFKEKHLHTGGVLLKIAQSYNLLKKWDLAIDYSKKAWAVYEKVYPNNHTNKVRVLCVWAEVLMRQSKTEEAMGKIQEALHQQLKEETVIREEIQFTYPITAFKNYSKYLIGTLRLKAKIWEAYYENVSHDTKDLELAVAHYLFAVKVIDAKRKSYKTEKSKLLQKHIAPVYEEGLQLTLKIQRFASSKIKDSAFLFAEKAKAAILLSTLSDVAAKLEVQLPSELLSKERKIKSRLAFLDKSIEKCKEEQQEEKLLKKYQNEYFDYHQAYLQLLQQLETDYPDYYQLKYENKTVTPTKLQSRLEENQVVISYFVGKDKLYIFAVSPDDIEVIDLQLPDDFEALIEGLIAALTQHQYTAFIEKSFQLHELLITPIQDFIVDDFGFDEELKQVFVIPHGVLSYVPFEALIGEEPLSRSATVDKVRTTLSTAGSLDNSLNINSWSGLDYLINHCEISYHYSATLLYRHLTKKQNQEETPHSFAGFAPIYDTQISSKPTAANLPKSEQIEVLQQSAKAMQAWVIRSDAIRSNGTWVSLPHSETEAKGIAELFEGKGLESEVFLREKASKTGFEEAAKRFKFLLVAAHGLVNDEKTALSGLVFYPSDRSEKRDERGERGEFHNEEYGERGGVKNLASDFSLLTSQTDSVLSMEETHHLDLQADLVVLSSCESGVGTLHKGEGMMAVNRGFLAAGANNVVSTLFKVYDKPSSLLTQYLFEAILEGEEYATALRLAKLKLMQQPNIDPKSWSGFVLIGG
ncbi:MAG: DUF2225 domain-containing protein [Chitinophagales bacterium]